MKSVPQTVTATPNTPKLQATGFPGSSKATSKLTCPTLFPEADSRLVASDNKAFPKAPHSVIICTSACKGLPYHVFGVYVYTIKDTWSLRDYSLETVCQLWRHSLRHTESG